MDNIPFSTVNFDTPLLLPITSTPLSPQPSSHNGGKKAVIEPSGLATILGLSIGAILGMVFFRITYKLAKCCLRRRRRRQLRVARALGPESELPIVIEA
ncbi:hypothetical protein FHL15_002334 [Xylaria flabelliformis]|uniref:Uncharacterized protein n=1 Tax=Xylaria flabelliformis TaxID=2512241 RepID=A0A553I8Y3_9PEZI|nr:hypothetical protein FHL15_002334 [Xylaria flabelliformis]